MMNGHAAKDPDDADDGVVSYIELKAFADGSMRVHGNIDNMPFALKMLDDAHAIIARRMARQPQLVGQKAEVVLNAEHDVVGVLQMKVRKNGGMSVAGDVDMGPYCLAMIANGKDTVRDHNARRRVEQGKAVILPGASTGLILPPGVRVQ